MGKPRNETLDYLTYLALRIVSMGVHSWGIHVSQAIARFIGGTMFYLDKKHRERAMANLRFSFPNMTDKQRHVIARQSMESLCLLAVEVLFTTRIVRIDTFNKYFELDGRFREVLKIMLERKQGLIMLTGHYSNWEVLGYLMATMGFPTSTVARPLDNPYLNEFVFGVRERTGQRMIDKTGATNELVDVLEKRGTVCFTADQNAGKKGIFVDFLGRKASAYKSIALLAMQFEVPIVVGYARRIGSGFRFLAGCQDIIYPADWKDEADPLRYITQRYTKAIEDFVRQAPGEYLWVHRRWKTRPKGEVAQKYD